MPCVAGAPHRTHRPAAIGIRMSIRTCSRLHHDPSAIGHHQIPNEVVRKLLAPTLGHLPQPLTPEAPIGDAVPYGIIPTRFRSYVLQGRRRTVLDVHRALHCDTDGLEVTCYQGVCNGSSQRLGATVTKFRDSQKSSISRRRRVLLGPGRFGRMRRWLSRRCSLSRPCARVIRSLGR
jgi:hypothetical protein